MDLISRILYYTIVQATISSALPHSDNYDGEDLGSLVISMSDADQKVETPDVVSPEKLELLNRGERAAYVISSVPMCNAQMYTISRQAKMTAALLVNNYNFSRRTRAALGARQIVDKNPGLFCRGLYNKLKRVHKDISSIEEQMVQSLGPGHVSILKNSIKQLKESLQEQMNRYGTRYSDYSFSTGGATSYKSGRGKAFNSRLRELGVGGVKNRAEVTIDSLVTSLSNLNTGCQRLKRSALY